MPKVIVIGNGFVASHLGYDKFDGKIEAKKDSIKLFLEKYKPDCVVNAFGFCGNPNVDVCEIEKEKTLQSNLIIPSILAFECEKLGIHYLSIGSGCIFFGQSQNILDGKDCGWLESDFANPQSFYSKTKYCHDLSVGQLKNATILRIRMPVSHKNETRNFVNKVSKYSSIIDIPNSMTIMDDLVRCVDWAIKESKTGIYHVTNPEPISAADVMREYQKYDPSHRFKVITEAELDAITVAKRSNCILSTKKLNDEGFFMTPSREALSICMNRYFQGNAR
jgi:UDP-glucose 4,6-dehydratase